MQYLLVTAKAKKTGDAITAPVLIDGVENGQTDSVLLLDRGVYGISVKTKGAETRTVLVDNSTQEKPVTVSIDIEDVEQTPPPEAPVSGPSILSKLIGVFFNKNKKA